MGVQSLAILIFTVVINKHAICNCLASATVLSSCESCMVIVATPRSITIVFWATYTTYINSCGILATTNFYLDTKDTVHRFYSFIVLSARIKLKKSLDNDFTNMIKASEFVFYITVSRRNIIFFWTTCLCNCATLSTKAILYRMSYCCIFSGVWAITTWVLRFWA